MTKAEQTRLLTWRSKVLQYAGDGNRAVAQTCRHFGISRKTYYKWRERFNGPTEMRAVRSPATPHRSPRATPPEVVSKILYLRQHYHFGAGRIADYLRRFHHVAVAFVRAPSLQHGVGRLPGNQKHRPHGRRWQRYEKPQPGHRLQVDVKFLERIPGSRSGSTSSPRSTTAPGFAC